MIRGVPTSQGSARDFTEGVLEIRRGLDTYAHVYAQDTQDTSARKELLTELPESHGDIESQICPKQYRYQYDLMSVRF